MGHVLGRKNLTAPLPSLSPAPSPPPYFPCIHHLHPVSYVVSWCRFVGERRCTETNDYLTLPVVVVAVVVFEAIVHGA